MKILYHHRTLSKDGQDVHVQAIVGALSRRGHEVIVVAPGASRQGAVQSKDTSSRLRALLPRAVAELLELAYSVPAYLHLMRAWKQHRPDILYERYNLFLLSGVWLRAQTGIPLLLEVNAPLYEERRLNSGLAWQKLAQWAERYVWRRNDVALPVTAVLANYLRAADVPDERIRVIANGADPAPASEALDRAAARRELRLDGKLVLGFTGFIRSWHGLVHVIDAMANLGDLPDVHFLVVGDGPGRMEIEERARALGIAHHVTFLGLVDRDRVGFYVSAFDIALQPHAVAYASPLKLFEYMALGRAIIAPDQPNIREILRHERDALLFDLADPLGFATAITRLCRDSDLRMRLGAEALRTVERGRYRWSENAAEIERIALHLLNSVEGSISKSEQGLLSANDG